MPLDDPKAGARVVVAEADQNLADRRVANGQRHDDVLTAFDRSLIGRDVIEVRLPISLTDPILTADVLELVAGAAEQCRAMLDERNRMRRNPSQRTEQLLDRAVLIDVAGALRELGDKMRARRRRRRT